MKKGRQDRIAETLTMILYYFMYPFHHKHLIYTHSTKGETGEPPK